MATKADFSEQEWAALRNAPHVAAVAVAAAGSSGLGTFKESFAAMQAVMEGLHGDNALVRELAAKDEVVAGQTFLRGQMSFGMSQQQLTDTLQGLSADLLGQAMRALRARSPADADAYAKWIGGIAQKVANAATEGGFLGFGGERLSGGEKTMIAKLQDALKAA